VVNITVNNRPVEAKEGQTLLEALQGQGIRVPTLCHLRDLTPTGACRLCVVDVEGQRNLVPSCAYPVQEGMRVQTHSQRAVRARRTIVELLLSNHPDDCLYCVRSGNCDLQDLAIELGVRERRFGCAPRECHVDLSSPSIVRDPAKCILCGRCVRVCEEIQAVGAIDFIGRGSQTRVGTAFDQGLNVSSCVNCGQCIVVCPTGALRERSHLREVATALEDPAKHVVVQHAPSISVTLAEEFGMKPGRDVDGVMTAALRVLGFDRVFDTSFAADLTILEEASELVHRLQQGGALPLMTSCSPGWVKFVEQFYPDYLENVSTCKSPQQMLGAVIKTYYAQQAGLDPADIFSVSIMPCTAKKFEAERPEMGRNGVRDVDAVLTTRELARLIRQRGIDPRALAPEAADSPLGERTSAGKLFGVTGGVMEAAIRTAHHMVTGEELGAVNLKQIRGLSGVKEARVAVNGLELGVAVVNGLGNLRVLMEQMRDGRDDLHFIEVMTCPGGCIGGGGQPIRADRDAIKARMRALYRIDRDEPMRRSHENASVKRLYDEFLGEPLGAKSHELLHTHYAERMVVK
jgi:NADH-quinone oxidoreductase subunit G/NADP-reducing hydrogenase subunit HndD